jgi:hypothetical protein
MDFLQVSKVKPFDQTDKPDPGPAAPASTEPDAPAGFDALMAMAEHQLAQRFREQGLAGFTGVPTPTPATAPQPPAEMASNCKPAATVPAPTPGFPRNFPRNAPCRCGSGAKYKRCCGNPAAATLGKVA